MNAQCARKGEYHGYNKTVHLPLFGLSLSLYLHQWHKNECIHFRTESVLNTIAAMKKSTNQKNIGGKTHRWKLNAHIKGGITAINGQFQNQDVRFRFLSPQKHFLCHAFTIYLSLMNYSTYENSSFG